ncbi:MAG: hypothetical protein HC834_05225, partial [Rhodospirillales bacterium]|nr:hypothetical protein [Rhodospirillales bacterium]
MTPTHDDQHGEDSPQCVVEYVGRRQSDDAGPIADERERAGQQQGEHRHQAEVIAEATVDEIDDGVWRDAGEPRARLVREAAVGLAQILAARIETTAEGADGATVGGARRHVLAFEGMFAHDAVRVAGPRPIVQLHLITGEIVAAARRPGEQRREEERQDERDVGAHGTHDVAGDARRRHAGHEGRDPHGADTDGVDVVEVSAFELDPGRRQSEWLADHEVAGQRADPGDRDDRIEPEDLLQRLEDPELQQQERDGDVEDEPDDPAGMAQRQPREEVGPRDGAGVRVGHVDLDLRDDDERYRQQDRQLRRYRKLLKCNEINPRRIGRFARRQPACQRVDRQIRSDQHLDGAENDPPRTSQDERDPPRPRRPFVGRMRQEPQIVDLLPDLRHQREQHRRGGPEQHEVEARALAVHAAVRHPLGPDARSERHDGDQRKKMQRDPDRLRPHLQTSDESDPVGHHGNDDDGTHDGADPGRDAEAEVKGLGHDGRLDGEEDEGEGCVDERRHGGAEIAEAGAASQQIDVDAVPRGVIADRQAREENQRTDDAIARTAW